MLTLVPKKGVQKIIKTFLIFRFPTGVIPTGVTLSCDYLDEFSKKILNGPNGIIRDLGETDSRKKPEAKNLVTLSL